MPTIAVFASHTDSTPTPSSIAVLSAAASLGTPVAVVAGPVDDQALAVLGQAGATTVFQCTDPKTLNGLAIPQASLLAAAVRASGATIVLVPDSPEGNEVAALAAAELKAGLVTGASDLTVDESHLVVEKSIWSGAYNSTVKVTSPIAIATVKAPSTGPVAQGTQATLSALPLPDSGPSAEVTHYEVSAGSGRPSLADAATVVAGGRGVNGDFALVESLADCLDAAIGASRAAVDAGWAPASAQVGQTGKTVTPELYVALGISGAIQHVAGMRTAQRILSINSDPDAPIHRIADLSIVGDIRTIVPAATARLNEIRDQ